MSNIENRVIDINDRLISVDKKIDTLMMDVRRLSIGINEVMREIKTK